MNIRLLHVVVNRANLHSPLLIGCVFLFLSIASVQSVAQVNGYDPFNPSKSVRIGMTADEVMEHTNRGRYGPSPQENVKNDPAYQTPNADNGFTNPYAKEQVMGLPEIAEAKRMQETYLKMQQVAKINQQVNRSGHYQNPGFRADLTKYYRAFEELKSMLEGNRTLSIADAFYIEEAAYGNLLMSYAEYKENISQSAAFIRQWIIENHLNPDTEENVHLAIQKFMGDTLRVRNTSSEFMGGATLPTGHQPYIYDYGDYEAQEDHRNYFITKALATGSGQCHALPMVYLVLAEAMEVDAYLSFSPIHSFVKYKDSKGTVKNYEPTVDWHLSDQHYMEEMPIFSSALKYKLYLDTLNKRQIVASAMIELGYNFYREHWIADGRFINQCIDYASEFFYSKENDQGLLLKEVIAVAKLDYTMFQAGVSDLSVAARHPKTAQAYAEYQAIEDKIIQYGIQDFPESKFQEIMERHDHKGRLQVVQHIDTKSKKSLFFSFE